MEKVKADEDRLNELEIQVKELTNHVSRLSEIISDQRRSKNNEPSLYTGRYSMEHVNPWSLAALDSDLGAAFSQRISSSPRYNASHLDIYKPTIAALKSNEEGYTAEEVSGITKRSRNTESGHMNRLFRAGILKRVRKGKRVNYVLADKDLADKIFETL